MIRATCSGPSRSWDRSRSERLLPSTSSITRKSRSSQDPKSKTATRCGWLSRAAVWASSRNRAVADSSACSPSSSFTATDRPRTSSVARQTSPIPPRPMADINRYRPATSTCAHLSRIARVSRTARPRTAPAAAAATSPGTRGGVGARGKIRISGAGAPGDPPSLSPGRPGRDGPAGPPRSPAPHGLRNPRRARSAPVPLRGTARRKRPER